MKYLAHIPVRLGSKRVKKKNVRLINGIPLVGYAINACKESKLLDGIFLNSESDLLRRLAIEYDVDFYERPAELLRDEVVQDQFNYDFLIKHECENLVLVNPVSPLVLGQDIDDAIRHFELNKLDSLISVRKEKYQAFYQEKPLNFSCDSLLPMTQNLSSVDLCCWTVCIWNREKFLAEFEKNQYAVFVGKFGLFPFDHLRSLKISNESDFRLAEALLHAREAAEKKPKYYE